MAGLSDLFSALGLVLVIEGVAYAVAPQAVKALIRQALDQPDGVLRAAGLAAAVLGVAIVALARL